MGNFVLETINKRRSVRKYSDEKLTKDQFDTILEAALISPSAMNRQPWHISAVSSKEIILSIEKDIIRYYKDNGPEIVAENNAKRDNKIFYNAPTVFFLSRDPADNTAIDIGILAQSITLASQSLGLNSVILGLPRVAFPPIVGNKWVDKFEFPENYIFTIAVAVGHGLEPGRDREIDMSKLSIIE